MIKGRLDSAGVSEASRKKQLFPENRKWEAIQTVLNGFPVCVCYFQTIFELKQSSCGWICPVFQCRTRWSRARVRWWPSIAAAIRTRSRSALRPSSAPVSPDRSLAPREPGPPAWKVIKKELQMHLLIFKQGWFKYIMEMCEGQHQEAPQSEDESRCELRSSSDYRWNCVLDKLISPGPCAPKQQHPRYFSQHKLCTFSLSSPEPIMEFSQHLGALFSPSVFHTPFSTW